MDITKCNIMSFRLCKCVCCIDYLYQWQGSSTARRGRVACARAAAAHGSRVRVRRAAPRPRRPRPCPRRSGQKRNYTDVRFKKGLNKHLARSRPSKAISVSVPRNKCYNLKITTTAIFVIYSHLAST